MFRPLGLSVRIDDPLWPVVRETSRVLLRRDNLHLEIPVEFKEDIESLFLEMSDYQPAKLHVPTFEISLRNDVCISQREQEGGELQMIGYIGMEEPGQNVRWVKMPTYEGWKEVISACHELHEAGYPGCIGCGGPNSELPWDENKSRSRL
jgi:hypothetical protein